MRCLSSSNIFWNHANSSVLNEEIYTQSSKVGFLNLFTELLHRFFLVHQMFMKFCIQLDIAGTYSLRWLAFRLILERSPHNHDAFLVYMTSDDPCQWCYIVTDAIP